MALPTMEEILSRTLAELDQSRWHLSEAGNWLRSDWAKQPTRRQVEAKNEVQDLLGEAKGLIDRMKSAIYGAED